MQLAIGAGVEVVTVPGASSVTAALSISGLATDRFTFEGFLPARQVARQKRLANLGSESRTMVFFESSHRIRESLADLAAVFGQGRRMAVCREMTKQFETVLRGTVAEVIDRVEADSDQVKRGIRAGGCGPVKTRTKTSRALAMARALQEYLSSSQAARVAAKLCDVPRRELYELMGSARRNQTETIGRLICCQLPGECGK